MSIDRLIERHVFGVEPREVRIRGGTNTVTVYVANPALADGTWLEHELRAYREPRHFSTDPAAAWSVVDKVHADHPTWRFALSCTGGGKQWRASLYTFDPHDDSGGSVEGQAKHATRELAICIAALRAVGCPESDIETATSERRGG